MCFTNDDEYRDTYESSVEIRNGRRYYTQQYYPGHGMSRRRRFGFGGSYYPSRYYAGPPARRYVGGPVAYPARYSRYGGGYAGGVVPGGYSRGVVPGGYSQAMVPGSFGGVRHSGYSYGYAYVPGYLTGARQLMPLHSGARATYYSTPPYGHPATTTTTYHITNSQAAPTPFRETRPAYSTHGHAQQQGPTREAIQMENRRIATERGSYDARKIRPADARDDDPFWCREINGEWHLRTYYQIENECHPGRWMMDAEIGFLVFHRM